MFRKVKHFDREQYVRLLQRVKEECDKKSLVVTRIAREFRISKGSLWKLLTLNGIIENMGGHGNDAQWVWRAELSIDNIVDVILPKTDQPELLNTSVPRHFKSHEFRQNLALYKEDVKEKYATACRMSEHYAEQLVALKKLEKGLEAS